MMRPPDEGLFSAELWEEPLKKFAETARVTVRLFDAEPRSVVGPLHSTPLFQL